MKRSIWQEIVLFIQFISGNPPMAHESRRIIPKADVPASWQESTEWLLRGSP